MPTRVLDPSASFAPDLVFPFPRNWMPIIFFGILGVLHWGNAAISFAHSHYEAYLSIFFGALFIGAAFGWRLIRNDLGVLPSEKRLRVRSRLGKLATERSIPFDRVHGIRLYANGGEDGDGSRVEILCENEDIECPPTRIARQQALCLAVLLNVQLIKVTGDSTGDGPDRARPVPQEQPN